MKMIWSLCQVDRRNMFWLIKKKLAKEYEVVLSYEDRYSDLSHRIMQNIWKSGLVEYTIAENRIKNVIYSAMENYIESFEDVEESVAEKITHYKRKLIPGSPEYDLVFEKLYEDELRKKRSFVVTLQPIWIYLENGIYLEGKSFGCEGTKSAELVFNTSMTGYQEIMSDPSYAGQFVLFTMPEIGIVGTNENDMESSTVYASGALVRSFNKKSVKFQINQFF